MPAVSVRPQLTYTDSHTRACRRTGSQAVADLLADYLAQLQRTFAPELPEGFTMLGSGATRRALLGPDGFVYKCELAGYRLVNTTEVKFWALGLAHPEYRPHIPHHRLLHVGQMQVLAMERADVERDRALTPDHPEWKGIKKLGDHIGYADLHRGNIGWRGDRALLIDAGGGTTGDVYRSSGCRDCNPRYEA